MASPSGSGTLAGGARRGLPTLALVLPFVLLACQRAAPGGGGGSGGAGRPATAADPVVAGADGLEVRAGDLAYAWARVREAGASAGPAGGAAAGAAGAPPRAQVEELVREVLAYEALAREARALPGASEAAAAAARQAAATELVRREAAAAAEPARLEAYYRDHLGDFEVPAEVKALTIRFKDCAAAAQVRAEIERGALSFEAAAVREGRGVVPPTAAWEREARLPAEVSGALAALGPEPAPGSLGAPYRLADGCLLLKLLERRPGRTRPFAEVRAKVAHRVAQTGLEAARSALLTRLGGAAGARIDEARLLAAVADAPGADPAAAVVTLGADRVTTADVRVRLGGARSAGPGGVSAFGRRLAEDLVLDREARRRGLDGGPAARAAARQALVDALRASELQAVTPTSVTAAEVAAAHAAAPGAYAEPARVRVAALLTRDRKRAERWVAALRAAPHPADAFARLLPESEDVATRARGGDLGWIDERSTHVPEPFKHAALLLPRPGAVTGPQPAAGAYHVLLCRDRVAARAKPLAEVEAQIRDLLVDRRRREVWEARVAAARGRRQPALDWAAVATVPWDAP